MCAGQARHRPAVSDSELCRAPRIGTARHARALPLLLRTPLVDSLFFDPGLARGVHPPPPRPRRPTLNGLAGDLQRRRPAQTSSVAAGAPAKEAEAGQPRLTGRQALPLRSRCAWALLAPAAWAAEPQTSRCKVSIWRQKPRWFTVTIDDESVASPQQQAACV